MMQFVFFGVSFLVLLSGHALLWFATAKLFHISAWHWQAIFVAFLAFLFLSSLISSYLIHRWDNLFTRYYYMFSGFWIGLGVNMLLILIPIGLIWLAGSIFGFSVPENALKITWLVASLAISLLGVYRAVMPHVVEYEARIKDLPEAWDGKSIVQLSDIHLGPVYRQRFFLPLNCHDQ